MGGREEDEESEPVEADLYRHLFERSADAILIIEGESFVDCNQATVEMLRCSDRAQVLETHPSELSPPTQPDGRDSFEKANEMISRAFEQGSHRFEWDHRRADGEVFPVEVLLTVIRRGDKPLLHVVWRDITERRHLEQHLRQSQKMEAIGRFAGGIAHDFNNLLVAIMGNADLISMAVEDQPDLLGNIEEIQHASERAAALVRELMTFSRKGETSPRVLDLNEVLPGLRRLLPRLIGADVQLEVVPCDRPAWVKIDPVEIERIVLNLATNARDAMPSGGTLTLEVRLVELHDAAGVHDALADGTYAVLAVSDTGTGMTPETKARVFDPFFTTKPPGQGTGLGLSTVYGVAHSGGGTVHVRSALGEGTTVEVYLPRSRASAPGAETELAALPTEGGDETILVAEDQASVSNLIVRVLRASGYRVLLARDGAEALSMWEHYGNKIDLLLTDVVMPKLGGVDLVKRLLEQDAAPRVLFASGYTNNALAGLATIAGEIAGELDSEIDLLEKPFSAAELVGRVRQALDR